MEGISPDGRDFAADFKEWATRQRDDGFCLMKAILAKVEMPEDDRRRLMMQRPPIGLILKRLPAVWRIAYLKAHTDACLGLAIAP